MNSLLSLNPIALSLLINEDIYKIADGVENSAKAAFNQPELVAEKPLEPIAMVTEAVTVKPSYQYIGDNHKSILILVNEVEAEILKKEDLLALNKMLGARKLEQKDVAILNIQKNINLNFRDLKDFFGFNKLVLFGINPNVLNITGIIANQIGTFENRPILGTWHIKQMQADEKKKLIFWTELKKLI